MVGKEIDYVKSKDHIKDLDSNIHISHINFEEVVKNSNVVSSINNTHIDSNDHRLNLIEEELSPVMDKIHIKLERMPKGSGGVYEDIVPLYINAMSYFEDRKEWTELEISRLTKLNKMLVEALQQAKSIALSSEVLRFNQDIFNKYKETHSEQMKWFKEMIQDRFGSETKFDKLQKDVEELKKKLLKTKNEQQEEAVHEDTKNSLHDKLEENEEAEDSDKEFSEAENKKSDDEIQLSEEDKAELEKIPNQLDRARYVVKKYPAIKIQMLVKYAKAGFGAAAQARRELLEKS